MSRKPPGEGFVSKAELLQTLESLSEKGVEFCISIYDGMLTIGPADVLEYAKGPEQFVAKQWGVSVEHFRAWKRWESACCPCSGTTRRGTRCKLHGRWLHVRDFIPGESDYCDLHLGQSVLHRNRNDLAVTLRPQRSLLFNPLGPPGKTAHSSQSA